MESGKLNWDDLKRIINISKKVQRDDVRIRSGVGEDCSVVNFGDYECVISTDPITGAGKNSGRLAVHINCNDAAACGVEPIGLTVTILAPPSTELCEIENIMIEISEETEKLNVEILGGHTEITPAVNKIIISCTVIGKGKAMSAISTSGAKVNDDIIVTKFLGMEGSSIIANDYEKLISEFLCEDEVKEAKSYIESISVVKEGLLCGKLGVNAMHDITEGGVLGALWELADASNKGFEVYDEKMPISNVTNKICKELQIDVLRFISSGSMLITTSNGESVIEKLKQQGITATKIGKITENKGLIIKNKIVVEVIPPERDELFKFMENHK